jgi:glycerophosphoryl diester phosphodiesterase
VLLASASSLVLGACSVNAPQGSVRRIHTVDGLLSTTPFYIAHRGSGDNWPEHTQLAYSSAVRAGAKAIEVSVHSTADGVLVCHHDANTARVTGADREISSLDYATVSNLRVNTRQWLGPTAPLEPIPRLADVLDAHAAARVIFLEDKQGTNRTALLDLMDTYPDATNHFVWKQVAGTKGYAEVAERGYRTWGYFTNGQAELFERYASRHDFLGIYHASSDEEIRQLIGLGKPVIAWEVHTRWMRDRLLALGVQGMMCSNFPYVTKDAALLTRDSFASGVRSPGDLPSRISWKFQPRLIPASSAIRLLDHESEGYILGSMCPVQEESYSLRFDMRWPEQMPAHVEAGIGFAQQEDFPVQPGDANAGGYHLFLRQDGWLRLLAPGAGRKEIGTLETPPAVSGKWMSFEVQVDPERITISRLDVGRLSLRVGNKDARGGYFSLWKNYDGQFPVEFRNVHVSA